MTSATTPIANGQPQQDAVRWDNEQVVKHLRQRTFSEDARFMLHLLQPGMQVLDCGCGPGSITLGLAPFVAPGQVRGIDISDTLIEQAKSAAEQQGVADVRFEVGDALELPFEDHSFDLVFSHALMEHLPNPMDGLAQMKRVLKPGGMVAIRTPDWEGNMFYPDTTNLHDRFRNVHVAMFRHNHSDPYRGRHLGKMLDELGFVDLAVTASYTCYGTREKVADIAQLFTEFFMGPSRIDMIVSNGWATREEVEQIRAELRSWVQMPGAFHMRNWIEAVARKP